MRLKHIIIIIIIGIVVFFVLAMFPVILDELYIVTSSGEIEKLIKRNSNIQSINECWGWYGSGGDFFAPIALDIKMEDDKRLFLSFIRSPRLKTPFYLNLIGSSVFSVRFSTYENGNDGGSSHGIPIKLISQETGIQINSVDDVVNNYDEIYVFINSLAKYRTNNDIVGYNWFKEAKPIFFNTQYWHIINNTYAEDPDHYRLFREYGGKRVKVVQLGHGNFNKPAL
jgi:hypothetical protein